MVNMPLPHKPAERTSAVWKLVIFPDDECMDVDTSPIDLHFNTQERKKLHMDCIKFSVEGFVHVVDHIRLKSYYFEMEFKT